MFFRDLRNTYRDFLLVLLGIMLLITLLDVFNVGAAAGSLLALIFSVRYLNTLLYKSVFDKDGSVLDLHVSLTQLICSKTALLLCYNTVFILVFFVCQYLKRDYLTLSFNLPIYVDFDGNLQVGGSLLWAVLSKIIGGTVMCLSFFPLMAICCKKMKNAETACRVAWSVFWLLNIFIESFLLTPLLEMGIWSVFKFVGAEQLVNLLLGAIYIAISAIILKNQYHFSE